MLVYMRNKTTGEIRPVEAESQEFFDLQAEVKADGQPKWEQTHLHHANAVEDRREAGSLNDEDLGEVDQPKGLTKDSPEGVGPDLHPETALTPGEREAGIESYEQKVKELAEVPGSPPGPNVPGETVHEDAGKVTGGRRKRARQPTSPTSSTEDEKDTGTEKEKATAGAGKES